MLMAQAATLLSPVAKSKCRWRGALATDKMTSLVAATLGPSGGVAAGRMISEGLGLALPCPSAKRSRLLPEVFDDCSYVGRRLYLRERAVIREVNETVFANISRRREVLVVVSHVKKVEYSILSTDLASSALRRLHSVISDVRPPSGTLFGETVESCHWRFFVDFR